MYFALFLALSFLKKNHKRSSVDQVHFIGDQAVNDCAHFPLGKISIINTIGSANKEK